MVGIQANGDVKLVTKVLTAIAYFNKGKSVAEVLHNIEHLTQEQKERWTRLIVAMYDQFTADEEDEEDEMCYPDGSDYRWKPEPKINEEDYPF
jgi:hypothetical protein